MKSLKAKFRKADVSAVPKDMGTCPGLPVPRGVSGFHRGLGTQGPASGCPMFCMGMGTWGPVPSGQ